jgi:hypothetical protein
MTIAGFSAALDVDLMLEADNSPDCLLCSGEAVMVGIIGTPCSCPQPLCLAHYERELPRWTPGDPIHCYPCPWTVDNGGEFIRWERAK